MAGKMKDNRPISTDKFSKPIRVIVRGAAERGSADDQIKREIKMMLSDMLKDYLKKNMPETGA